MRITHRTAQRAADAAPQPRINPLRIVQDDEFPPFAPGAPIPVTDIEELKKFIMYEFEPFLEKFEKFYKMVVQAGMEHEAKEHLAAAKKIASAIDVLDKMKFRNAKNTKEDFRYVLNQMSNFDISEAFINLCENPEVCLESDELY